MTQRTEPTRHLECSDCGIVFEHVGRGRCLRCVDCRKANAAERARQYAIRKGRIKRPGVGSGGAQHGELNHQWKGGVAAYRKYGKEGKQLVCETCGTALNQQTWCVHHINEDRSDNRRENLKLVCRKCHQMVEHGDDRARDEQGKFTSRNKIPE